MKLTKEQVDKLHKKLKINTLYLFGSRATGKAGAESDWDFAVILDEKVQADAYFDYQIKILSQLESITNDRKRIDLVILNDKKLPLLLKFNAIREGVILMRNDEIQRINTEAGISSLWKDWSYFEKLYYEIRFNIKNKKKYDRGKIYAGQASGKLGRGD